MNQAAASLTPVALAPASPTSTRRQTNYWEPIYNPSDFGPFPELSWDFLHNRGPAHGTLNAKGMWNQFPDGAAKIWEITFTKCDFRGRFEKKPIVFKNCRFEGCDFGYTFWKKAKFTECTFKSCSLSLATFADCEFRDCTWERIGISGNETKLPGTLITNPEAFIAAAYTNLDRDTLTKVGKTPEEQKMRLERTKSTVSRSILNTLSQIGEEEDYYEAVKTCLNQSLTARISHANYSAGMAQGVFRKIFHLSRMQIYLAEKKIINLSGQINCWGASIARPCIIGLAIIALFTLAYYAAGVRPDLPSALMASVDVSLLIGYTKHVSRGIPRFDQAIFALNMGIGLAWYAVFVPTIINRISRVR